MFEESYAVEHNVLRRTRWRTQILKHPWPHPGTSPTLTLRQSTPPVAAGADGIMRIIYDDLGGVWARGIEAWAWSRDRRNLEFLRWGSSGPSSLMTSAVSGLLLRTHVPLIFLDRDKKSYRLSEKCATLYIYIFIYIYIYIYIYPTYICDSLGTKHNVICCRPPIALWNIVVPNLLIQGFSHDKLLCLLVI